MKLAKRFFHQPFFIVVALAAMVFVVAGFVGAEEKTDDGDPFSYYHFGNTSVEADPEMMEYSAGQTVKFNGYIVNNNEYPIFGGQVYVQIFQKNLADEFRNGDHLRDQFLFPNEINLNTGERQPFSFSWQVPGDAPGGEYKAVFSFVVIKKYNMAGLTFANNVYAGFTTFKIKNATQNQPPVLIDRNNIKFNNQPIFQRAFIPAIKDKETAYYEIPIQNIANVKKDVVIKQTLYYWDGLSEENKIGEKEEIVAIGPQEVYIFKYTQTELKEPVYFLILEAKESNQAASSIKSIINLRFAADKNSRARINYSGLTKFPLEKGDSFVFFTNFHSVSDQIFSKGEAAAILKDKAGNTLATLNHKGDITAAVQMKKQVLSADKNYDYLTIFSQIKDKEGKVIDQGMIVLDASKLTVSKTPFVFPKAVLLIILILLAVLSAVFIIRRRKRKPDGDNNSISAITAIVFLLFFGYLMTLYEGRTTEAQESFTSIAVPSSWSIGGCWYGSNYCFNGGVSINSVNFSFKLYDGGAVATVFKPALYGDTSETGVNYKKGEPRVNCGGAIYRGTYGKCGYYPIGNSASNVYSITKGASVKYDFAKNAEWGSTGSAWDTPPAYWKKKISKNDSAYNASGDYFDLDSPTAADFKNKIGCQANDVRKLGNLVIKLGNSYRTFNDLKIYTPVVIEDVGIALRGSGAITCDVNNNCTASGTGPGEIKVEIGKVSDTGNGLNLAFAQGFGHDFYYIGNNVNNRYCVFEDYAPSGGGVLWQKGIIGYMPDGQIYKFNVIPAAPAPIAAYALTVTKSGVGSGTVTSVSNPSQANQINCGITCATTSVTYNSGASVTLSAAAASGSTFTGWSGGAPACSGAGSCVVTMNQAQTVTATFTKNNQAPTAALDIQNVSGASISSTNVDTDVYLNVKGSSDLDGNISSVKFCSDDTPADSACDSAWTADYIWVVSDNGAGWDAAAKKKTWLFTTAGDKGVYTQVKDNNGAWDATPAEDTINVILPTFSLSISKDGTGTGNVQGYYLGDVNRDGVLTGDDADLIFLYSGGSGNPDAQQFALADVDSSGRVTSGDALAIYSILTNVNGSVNCGSTCSKDELSGKKLVLFSTADVGSAFTGWSGGAPACSGAGSCVVTMNQAQAITATFTKNNLPPSANNLQNNPPADADYCGATPAAYTFSWQYSDPDAGDTESRFQFQIDDKANFADCNAGPGCEISKDFTNLSNPNPTVNRQQIGIGASESENQIAYNKTYYWRSRVFDSKGAASVWTTLANNGQFTTKKHAYPAVGFTWDPKYPSAKQKVNFTDKTVFSDGGGIHRWAWTFVDASPGNASAQNPDTKFQSNGAKQVSLTATDKDNYACAYAPTPGILVMDPLPGWVETKP